MKLINGFWEEEKKVTLDELIKNVCSKHGMKLITNLSNGIIILRNDVGQDIYFTYEKLLTYTELSKTRVPDLSEIFNMSNCNLTSFNEIKLSDLAVKIIDYMRMFNYNFSVEQLDNLLRFILQSDDFDFGFSIIKEISRNKNIKNNVLKTNKWIIYVKRWIHHIL